MLLEKAGAATLERFEREFLADHLIFLELRERIEALRTVEADLIETREACARHGCPLEYILKDISTVRYQPQRLWEWADVAMKVVRNEAA